MSECGGKEEGRGGERGGRGGEIEGRGGEGGRGGGERGGRGDEGGRCSGERAGRNSCTWRRAAVMGQGQKLTALIRLLGS